jgi:alpha-amylase/alpha-mannosidase (GH57 family)
MVDHETTKWAFFNQHSVLPNQLQNIFIFALMSRKNKYICIHGHYYQPPRENAWLETVEHQESAHPFHDWNARINFECYAPNAAARILDESGWITKIRNNYNRISFNFGATLLSWMEENDPDAYDLLLKADIRSAERFGGHGSAVAQVHSHLIMPLANYRDKVTQVRWGIYDFQHRFNRYPEGIWLAETAVDTETLEVLAAHGIQYTILAPRQAKLVRPIKSNPDMGRAEEATWKPVATDSVDTRHPYWCLLPSGRRIALFFYHGEIAQEVAFNGLLNSGKALSKRLASVFDNNDEPQLSHVATDGESYGHHHRFGEMALADSLNFIEDNQLATLTNYGQYLELFPPTWEVQIHEKSSWSCVHGVERWRSDCGCNTGHAGWNQRWRKPLRDALDWLRDELTPLFEREGNRFLRDPWTARNDYIAVMLDRSDEAVNDFLKKHARRELSQLEKVAVLRLMEIQRFAILMYTSCGWFFDEISGIETNQILQYALRAMDYALDVFGVDLIPEFTRRLAEAPSNVMANGAVSFIKNVVPTRVTLERVATHFAIVSLFEKNPAGLNLFNYVASVDFIEKIEAGTPKFAIGRLRITSRVSHAEKTFCYAVLYLGQQHVIGNISGSMNRTTFEEMCTRTSKSFRAANLGELIGVLQEYFGPEKFSLSSLFSDEKIAIIQAITENSLDSAESTFRNVFNENYQLMSALEEAKMPMPASWNNIASYLLNADLKSFFENPEMGDLRILRRIEADIKRWNVKLNDEEMLNHAIGQRVFDEIEKINLDESSVLRVTWIVEVLNISSKIGLKPRIWRSQNIFYLITKGYRKGQWVFIGPEWETAFKNLSSLLKVRLTG